VGVHCQGFGVWAWPLEASHYGWPKALNPIFYCLLIAHFFGHLTKFGSFMPMASRLGQPYCEVALKPNPIAIFGGFFF